METRPEQFIAPGFDRTLENGLEGFENKIVPQVRGVRSPGGLMRHWREEENMAAITVAKALRQGKQLKGTIATLRARLGTTTSWVEGKPSAFKFEETLAAHDKAVEELTKLKAAIAASNATTEVEHRGRTMSVAEAIHRMSELKGRLDMYQGFQLRSGKERGDLTSYDAHNRPVYEPVEWKSALSEPERAAKLDEIRKELEELNEALEEANHRTKVEA